MRKNIFFILFCFVMVFILMPKASADGEVCQYRSDKAANNGFGYDVAKLNKNGDWTVDFTNLTIPNVGCNWGEDVVDFFTRNVPRVTGTMSGPLGLMIGGAAGDAAADPMTQHRCAGNVNDIDTKKVKDLGNVNVKVDRNVFYTDQSGKKTVEETVPLKEFENTCPKYLMVFVSDDPSATNYRVFAGDDDVKDFLVSKFSQNTRYNYLIIGGKYYSDAQDSGNQETLPDLNTCDGLLGVKVNNKYTEDSVGGLVQKIFDYMKLAAVAMTLVFSTIDYAKAIVAQDGDKFKKANQNLIKRVIFTIVFFLLPEIVNIIVGIVDSSTCGIK